MYIVRMIIGNKPRTSGHFDSVLDAIAFMKKLQIAAYKSTLSTLPIALKSSVMQFDDNDYIACYVHYHTDKCYDVVKCDNNNNLYKLKLNLAEEKI